MLALTFFVVLLGFAVVSIANAANVPPDLEAEAQKTQCDVPVELVPAQMGSTQFQIHWNLHPQLATRGPLLVLPRKDHWGVTYCPPASAPFRVKSIHFAWRYSREGLTKIGLPVKRQEPFIQSELDLIELIGSSVSDRIGFWKRSNQDTDPCGAMRHIINSTNLEQSRSAVHLASKAEDKRGDVRSNYIYTRSAPFLDFPRISCKTFTVSLLGRLLAGRSRVWCNVHLLVSPDVSVRYTFTQPAPITGSVVGSKTETLTRFLRSLNITPEHPRPDSNFFEVCQRPAALDREG